MATERDLDLVLYGASGFVGKLTAAYLADHAPPGLRVALAGRNRTKLEQVRSDLGAVAADWSLLIADSADQGALRAAAERTTVVVTTVGPYAQYGMPMLAACAAAGTHYADLTGEVTFVRAAIDAHHETARRTGARIVNSCGFDSVPSDLGVLALHDAARQADVGSLEDTRLLLTGVRGGLSGGTFASMKGQIDELKSSKAVRRLIADPYALSPAPGDEPDVGRQPDPRSISRDPGSGRWLAPFVMSGYNTRIVRRSNALQQWAYGRRFRYQEYLAFSGPAGLALAAGVTAGLGVLTGGLLLPPTRALLDRVLPDPGEGPSEATRRNGYFHMEFESTTSSGTRLVGRVTAQGDPGYAATAVMLGEAGLALATEDTGLPDAAGVLTPASGIGQRLIDRLRAQNFTIEAAAA